MTEPPPRPARHSRRWLRPVLAAAAVLALLVIAMLLVGGGHTPVRHGGAGAAVPVRAVPVGIA
jgi:hypothetical protein